jgi:hypothetical protein
VADGIRTSKCTKGRDLQCLSLASALFTVHEIGMCHLVICVRPTDAVGGGCRCQELNQCQPGEEDTGDCQAVYSCYDHTGARRCVALHQCISTFAGLQAICGTCAPILHRM